MGLLIKKDGKLERDKYGKETEDATEFALQYLMEPCKIEDGVTLKDIFLILQRDIDVYKFIINNWVEELVEEGLSGRTDEEIENDCNIEYLELYWNLSAEIGKDKDFSGYLFPGFHGWGLWPDCEFDNYPKGTRGGIAVEFTPVYNLINCPVKLKSTVCLTVDKNYKQVGEPQMFENPEYSLFHILYGIIWELSFCGNPSERESAFANLKNLADQAKEEYSNRKK
mgnify:CR=1 FL=1